MAKKVESEHEHLNDKQIETLIRSLNTVLDLRRNRKCDDRLKARDAARETPDFKKLRVLLDEFFSKEDEFVVNIDLPIKISTLFPGKNTSHDNTRLFEFSLKSFKHHMMFYYVHCDFPSRFDIKEAKPMIDARAKCFSKVTNLMKKIANKTDKSFEEIYKDAIGDWLSRNQKRAIRGY